MAAIKQWKHGGGGGAVDEQRWTREETRKKRKGKKEEHNNLQHNSVFIRPQRRDKNRAYLEVEQCLYLGLDPKHGLA